MDKYNEAVLRGIKRIYSDMEHDFSIDEINDDILLLNQSIEEMKTTPDSEVVEGIELLQQAVIDYESLYSGDRQLEMIRSPKEP